MVQLNIPNDVEVRYTLDDLLVESLSPEEELLFRFNMYTSQRISAQRKKLSMTQEELAVKSGVSRVTISAIEKRRRVVSTEILLKLLDALNMSICFIER